VSATPEGVLRSILARLDNLESQRPSSSSEQLSANYLTISAAGLITALFTGGLQIPEGSSGLYSTANAIGWIDGGTIREYLTGLRQPGNTHQLGALSKPDAANSSRLTLTAVETATSFLGAASANFDVQDSSGGNVSRTAINSAGQSNYLQTAALVRSAVGTATLTWPAAGSFSTGLGVALPGASGAVNAVATPATNVTNPALFDTGIVTAFPNGAGGVNFQATTRGGGAPGATGVMTIAYLMWGN
jgi:hypothetical protein